MGARASAHTAARWLRHRLVALAGSACGRVCPVMELVPSARPSVPLTATSRLGARPFAPFPAFFFFSVPIKLQEFREAGKNLGVA